MSDRSITAIRLLEKAVAVQQTLFRTFALLVIEREISETEDWENPLRSLIDRWHALIDFDQTTSKTPETLKEDEREFSRQHVDALAAVVAFRRRSAGEEGQKDHA